MKYQHKNVTKPLLPRGQNRNRFFFKDSLIVANIFEKKMPVISRGKKVGLSGQIKNVLLRIIIAISLIYKLRFAFKKSNASTS